MKTSLTLSLLFFMTLAARTQTQNLVPNPSFEQHDTCPDDAGEINYAFPWTIAQSMTSPDYFNACNVSSVCDNHSTNVGVPCNFAGYQLARTGNGYALIVLDVLDFLNPLYDNHREYLEVKLLSKMKAGDKYCVSLYLSPCDSSNYICNDIGIYFSGIEIYDTLSGALFPLPFAPQVQNINDLSERNGWTIVSGEFTAVGGEEYMIIGNFKDHNSTTLVYTGWVNHVQSVSGAEIYIDDVSVHVCESDSIPIIPNIFTPNGDGINDLFIPIDPTTIKSGELNVFNRWGKEIFNTKNIPSGWDGNNFADGVYYYELIYKDEKELIHEMRGYVSLIR